MGREKSSLLQSRIFRGNMHLVVSIFFRQVVLEYQFSASDQALAFRALSRQNVSGSKKKIVVAPSRENSRLIRNAPTWVTTTRKTTESSRLNNILG